MAIENGLYGLLNILIGLLIYAMASSMFSNSDYALICAIEVMLMAYNPTKKR